MLKTATSNDDLSTVMAPVAQANGLPNRYYTDPVSLDLERRAVFNPGWVCIGFGAEVPNPGDVAPIDHLGAPLLLARDHACTLRVFQNVCRHRGMILVEEPRNVQGALRCPYHSWCYDLEGRLRATPHVGGAGINIHEAINRDTTGLIPVRHGVFMDCVFINLNGEGPDFDTWVAPLAERWREFTDKPLFRGQGSSFRLDINCNWKLAVENYCESYHLPWVHPGLNAYSRLEDHYNIHEKRAHAGQGTLVYNPDLGVDPAFPDFPGLGAKWERAAEYVALFPNVLLGVHRDHAFAIRLEPVAHDRTREHVEIYYTTEEAAMSEEYADPRARNAALWKEVFEEDIMVVEGMQRGRGAPGFDGGVFSPVMDESTHVFHDWMASRLAGWSESG